MENVLVRELFRDLQHPYTLGLRGSLPRLDQGQREPLLSFDGLPPALHDNAEKCCHANPILEEIAPGHRVACWVKPKTWSVQP